MALLTAEPTATELVNQLLESAVRDEISDIHLISDSPPAFRRHGRLCWTTDHPLDSSQMSELLRSLCPPEIMTKLRESHDADFALQRNFDGSPRRFRVNAFHSRGTLGCSIRVILQDVPSFEWSGFPSHVAEKICQFRNGLVLFTGVTGSGKSTTMAMIIQMLNERGGFRILTLEEPVEYVFEPRRDTIITQREVGTDVRSFSDGLKYGLRQDPDVILVGEIRDRETAQLAVTAAETGHLVLTTLHTRDAKGAITRLADMFSGGSQAELRSQLAMSLRCVISQHLLPPTNEGDRRALAFEVMLNSLPVSAAIRFGKVEALSDAILAGKSEGMICLDDRLCELVHCGSISAETARRFANNPKRLT